MEYFISLDPADCLDGPLAIGATVIPKDKGCESRVLEDITLYANSGGTLSNAEVMWCDATVGDDATGSGTETSPFKTISRALSKLSQSGGTIYLKASEEFYVFGSAVVPWVGTQWTLVTHEPSAKRENVRFRGPSDHRDKVDRLHLFDICCEYGGGGAIFRRRGSAGSTIWLDRCECYDPNGRHGSTANLLNNMGGCYATDCYVHDVYSAFKGDWRLVRGCEVYHIGEDAFRGAACIIGCSVTDSAADGTDAHVDVIQFYGPPTHVYTNILMYSVSAYDIRGQGLFAGVNVGTLQDVAFVNVLVHMKEGYQYYSQFETPMDHVLFWNVTWTNQRFYLRGGALSQYNVYVDDCYTPQLLNNLDDQSGLVMRNNRVGAAGGPKAVRPRPRRGGGR